MTVYVNGDFISFDENDTTYSIMVEDRGKIAYMGYNTPLCYRDAKSVDLEGKAVVPAINRCIEIEAKGATCSVLREGESADFAILDKNILKNDDASVLQVFVKGRDIRRSLFPHFSL